MKPVALFSVLMFAALPAFASAASVTKYVYRHSVPIYDASGAKECRKFGGTGGGSTPCMVPAKDTVVLKNVNGKLIVKVQTTGSDEDTCDFEGEGIEITPNFIRAAQASVDNESKAALCLVAATISGNSISIESSGSCEWLCGNHAGLGIERARRVK